MKLGNRHAGLVKNHPLWGRDGTVQPEETIASLGSRPLESQETCGVGFQNHPGKQVIGADGQILESALIQKG